MGEAVNPVALPFRGLDVSLEFFFSVYRAVELDLKLLKCSGRLAGGGEAGASPPVDEAAHIDDRGKKIATRVRTFESNEGRSVVYCSIEQITSG